MASGSARARTMRAARAVFTARAVDEVDAGIGGQAEVRLGFVARQHQVPRVRRDRAP